jgi:NADH-quinone oxidoreductase subunit J
MMASFTIFYFLSTACVLSSIMVIMSRNPIYSILFLVLVFTLVSFILLFLELEYLPLIFIVVYVGALTVLFLFVMLMLNIRATNFEKNLQLFPTSLLLCTLFLYQLFSVIYFEFLPLTNTWSLFCSDYSLVTSDILFSVLRYDIDPNMRGLGFLLYSKHFIVVILSSFILLLSMVGTITLTLRRYFTGRFQKPNFQIMQDFKTTK